MCDRIWQAWTWTCTLDVLKVKKYLELDMIDLSLCYVWVEPRILSKLSRLQKMLCIL